MFSETDISERIKPFIKTLPHTQVKYPESFSHKLRRKFWHVYTPYHETLRDTLVSIGIVRQKVKRQAFLLGKLPSNSVFEEFVKFLIDQGYGRHLVAWRDEGEILGLRYTEDFTYQYHLRIFNDGEIRGHYEYTPESHPVAHLIETVFEDRRQEFMKLLGDRIVPIKE